MVYKSPLILRAFAISRPTLRQRPLHRPLIITARYASASRNPPSNRAKNFIYGSSAIILLSLGYLYVTDTRASLHKYVVPRIQRLAFPDAEDAHHAGVEILKELYIFGIHPRERGRADSDGALAVKVFGETLANPVGISGGLDKNAEIVDALFAMGPSIVEVGGITARPQEGNERPRVFRVTSQAGLINRYGLNSDGADAVALRLRQRLREYAYAHGFGIGEEGEAIVLDGKAGVPPGSLAPGRLLAVQLAKNKETPEGDIQAIASDYTYCARQLGKYADILVVNVSSPNTPGLRSLQSSAPLTTILSAVVDAVKSTPRATKPKVMVKVSPDEDSKEQVQGICDAVWASGVDGIIVGNTTKKRPATIPAGSVLPQNEVLAQREQGGYSGPQLFDPLVSLVRQYRQVLDEGPSQSSDTKAASEGLQKKVIFASGGITNGAQVKEVLEAGASVAMAYTAIVYGGVGTMGRMKEELKKELKKS